MVLVVALVACGGGEEAPTCQEAIGHFYGAGCALFDTNGQPFSELVILEDCKRSLAIADDTSCEDEFADYRACLASVPSPGNAQSCSSCAAEQEALFTCD